MTARAFSTNRLSKATALSWMAKYMIPEKVRRLMGYHVKPKDKTVLILIYNRNALAAGLQSLTTIITDIHEGRFRPDAPRNTRFAGMDPLASESRVVQEGNEQDEALLPEPHNKWQMHEVPTPDKTSFRLVEADQLSSEEEETVDEAQDSEDERNLEAVVHARLGAPKKSNTDLYRHGLTGTIHRGSTDEGRPISAVMFKRGKRCEQLT